MSDEISDEIPVSTHTTYRDTNDGDVMDPAFGDQGTGDNYSNQAYVEGDQAKPNKLPPGYHIE